MPPRSLLVDSLLAAAGGLLLAAAPAAAAFRLERTLALAPGGELVVSAESGAVTVTGGTGTGAVVLITAEDDSVRERFDFALNAEPGRARVVVRRKDRGWLSGWRGWRGSGMHIQVKVPRHTRLDLQSSGGGLEITAIDGDARLRTSGGAIRARDVGGSVEGATSGGGVEVDGVRGDARLESSGGGIRAVEVAGDLYADTSGGGIEIADVAGDVEASTSGGGVRIARVGGRVVAHSSGGPVSAELLPGNSAGGSLSSSGGGVRVWLDPTARLSIDASSSGGGVACDLPVRGSSSRNSVRGDLNGGGATLRLRSSGGGIRIATNG